MDSRDDTIEVTGTGEGSGTPDLVVVDLRIHAEQESVAAALHTISRALRAVLDAARGSDPDLHPPQTIGLSVHPRHDHEGRSVVGFAAAQQIRFTVPSGERARELISLVSEAAGDALAVDQLSLAITDPAPPLRQARDAPTQRRWTRPSSWRRWPGASWARCARSPSRRRPSAGRSPGPKLTPHPVPG